MALRLAARRGVEVNLLLPRQSNHRLADIARHAALREMSCAGARVPAPPKRAAHYLWAVLTARIYEVFPLLCPLCGGQMHIITVIAHSADIRQILKRIGVDTQPPQIAPACGPPQSLSSNCPGAASVKAALRVGAVAFIHRFGSSLQGHVPFHVCVVDGVFEAVAGHAQADDVTDATAAPPSVIFYLASEIDKTAVALAQATLRKRILRASVGRGLLQSFEAKEMLGLSVGVCLACGQLRQGSSQCAAGRVRNRLQAGQHPCQRCRTLRLQ